MDWRVAKSLDIILQQVNQKWPVRDKSSDGTIGDAAHAARKSDHNPNKDGVVLARDITHDPAHGFNSYDFADMLLRNKDERISYIISNRRISSGTGQDHPAWTWRPYTGESAHDHHVHISIKDDARLYDDIRPWNLNGAVAPPIVAIPPVAVPAPIGSEHPILQFGSKGKDVGKLQTLLFIDGIFGHETEEAVKDFQQKRGLKVDGIVGFDTWQALLKDQKPDAPTVPIPPPVSPDQTSIALLGKVSWFGGPNDTGVKPSEGLALIDDVSDQPSIFLRVQPPGTTGLARRLNPDKFYIACRWDYKKYPKQSLLRHRALVQSPKTGLVFAAYPADWGPNENTGRIADISPGLMSALGILTDDIVRVVYPYDPVAAELQQKIDLPVVVTSEPKQPPPPPRDERGTSFTMAPTANWKDFDIWAWIKSKIWRK